MSKIFGPFCRYQDALPLSIGAGSLTDPVEWLGTLCDDSGRVYADMNGAPLEHSHGLPFDAFGRLCVTQDAISEYDQGVPLSAAGLVVIGNGPVVWWDQGVPLNAGGELVYSTAPNPAPPWAPGGPADFTVGPVVVYSDYSGTQVRATFRADEAADTSITHQFGIWLTILDPSTEDVKAGTGALYHDIQAGLSRVQVDHIFGALPDTDGYTLHWVVTDSRAVDYHENYDFAYSNTGASGSPAIVGDPRVTEVLSSSPGTITDPDGVTGASYTYQWNNVTGTPSTNSNYTVVMGDVGRDISVTVSFTDDMGFSESRTSAVVRIQGDQEATGKPNISGTAAVGSTLTASPGTINDPDGLTSPGYTYTWNGTSGIPSGPSYLCVSEDVGNVITVTAHFTDDRGFAGSRNSDPTLPVTEEPNNPATGAPDISGGVLVGDTLTASQGTISDPDGVGTITWTWNGVAGLPSGASYTIVEGDAGNSISVSASFIDGKGNSEGPLTSAAHGPIIGNRPATGAPVISGDELVGETLTSTAGSIADADGLTGVSYTYFWNNAAGGNKTQSSYTPVAGDAGRQLSVTYSFTDDRGYSESRTSAPTGAIVGNRPATGQPEILGIPEIGTELTADLGTLADPDGLGPITWTWTTHIGGTGTSNVGSGPTYTPTGDDEGKEIYVNASYIDGRDYSESVDSESVGPITGNRPATGSPNITVGGLRVGDVLTADPGDIDDPDGITGAVYIYTWLNVAGIPSGNPYIINIGDVGKNISVRASFTDDRGYSESRTSSAVGPVLGNQPATGQPVISGDALVGSTLTAGAGTIADPDGLTQVSYSWTWNGIAGSAIGNQYIPIASDTGNTISVTANFTDDRGFAESLTSADTPAIIGNRPATGAPAISGTPQVGEELTATAGTIADPDGVGTITYTWNGTASPHTGTTYTSVVEDVGSDITVSASFTDGRGYSEGPLTSTAVTIIARPAFFEHDFTTGDIGNFSFSRASKAWYYNDQGQIVEYGINVPAFGWSHTGPGDTLGKALGLMIEPQCEGLHAGSISMVDEDDTTNGPGLWNGFNTPSSYQDGEMSPMGVVAKRISMDVSEPNNSKFLRQKVPVVLGTKYWWRAIFKFDSASAANYMHLVRGSGIEGAGNENDHWATFHYPSGGRDSRGDGNGTNTGMMDHENYRTIPRCDGWYELAWSDIANETTGADPVPGVDGGSWYLCPTDFEMTARLQKPWETPANCRMDLAYFQMTQEAMLSSPILNDHLTQTYIREAAICNTPLSSLGIPDLDGDFAGQIVIHSGGTGVEWEGTQRVAYFYGSGTSFRVYRRSWSASEPYAQFAAYRSDNTETNPYTPDMDVYTTLHDRLDLRFYTRGTEIGIWCNGQRPRQGSPDGWFTKTLTQTQAERPPLTNLALGHADDDTAHMTGWIAKVRIEPGTFTNEEIASWD